STTLRCRRIRWVEGHDVQATRIDRPARAHVAQFADVGQPAAALEQRAFEVDQEVNARPRLPGDRQRAAGDQQVGPGRAVLGQFVIARVRQAGVCTGGDGVERADQGQEVELAQALLLRIAGDGAGFDQYGRYAGSRGQVAEGARVEGVVPPGDMAGDVGLDHGADGDRDPDGA